jgi:hypothetical protein
VDAEQAGQYRGGRSDAHAASAVSSAGACPLLVSEQALRLERLSRRWLGRLESLIIT